MRREVPVSSGSRGMHLPFSRGDLDGKTTSVSPSYSEAVLLKNLNTRVGLRGLHKAGSVWQLLTQPVNICGVWTWGERRDPLESRLGCRFSSTGQRTGGITTMAKRQAVHLCCSSSSFPSLYARTKEALLSLFPPTVVSTRPAYHGRQKHG